MNEFHKNRINRVIDYIQANIEKNLSLKQLSAVACYSEFHFNRIFRATMGESIYQYIRRLRLEKSAELLLTNTGKSITEIALDCGFSTPSSFAKSFKNHFKMNATEWRNRPNTLFDKESTPVQIENGQISIVKGSPVWTFHKEDLIRQVVVENFLPFKFAYVRNVGPYQGDEDLFSQLYTPLFRWAGSRGHLTEDTFTLNIYHDNPEITENNNLRVMVAIPVNSDIEPSGSVGVIRITGLVRRMASVL